jgi:hypothetical protein
MLSGGEILFVAAVIAPISLLSLLSARVSINKIPWLRLCRNLRYLGGLREAVVDGLWLVVWVGSSVAFSALVAVLAKAVGEPIVQSLYAEAHELVGYDEPATSGHAGMATIIAFTAWWYLFTVRKVHTLVHRGSVGAPRELFQPGGNPKRSGLVTTVIRQGGSRTWLFLTFLFYLGPLLLTPAYEHFYSRVGVILRCCTTLLMEEFGRDFPVHFYNHLRKTDDDERLVQIDKTIEGVTDRFQLVCTILIGLVRIHGFGATRQLLRNHERALPWNFLDEEYQGPERRRSRRSRPSIAVPCRLGPEGEERTTGAVADCSSDGSHLSIYSDRRMSRDLPVALQFQGKWIRGHVSAQRICSGKELAVLAIPIEAHRALIRRVVSPGA